MHTSLILGCRSFMYQSVRYLTKIVIVIAGVATAFAARDLLGNMLSGIAIQFSRPFSVGDYITVSLPCFV